MDETLQELVDRASRLTTVADGLECLDTDLTTVAGQMRIIIGRGKGCADVMDIQEVAEDARKSLKFLVSELADMQKYLASDIQRWGKENAVEPVYRDTPLKRMDE